MKNKLQHNYDKSNDFTFKLTGAISVDRTIKILRDHEGSIRGYELPDGREVLPILAFEVHSSGAVATTCKTIHKVDDFNKIGIDLVDYFETTFRDDFTERKNSPPNPESGN